MKTRSLLIFFLFFVFLLPGCKKENHIDKSLIEVEDDLGNKISLSGSPKKIISLAPNLTEIIFSIEADQYLVAVTKFCDYPQGASNKEKVGDLLNIDLEKVYSLKPDIIFMTVEGNNKSTYENLKKLGFQIFVSNPTNFNGILKTIKDIGLICGVYDKAEKISDSLKRIRDSLLVLNENFQKFSALFLISLNPLIAAGKNTFINEILTLANLENTIQTDKFKYPLISREEILKLNPDFLILPEDFQSEKDNFIQYYPEWKHLKSVKQNKIIYVEEDIFFRPSPRAFQAAVILRDKIKNFYSKM